MKMAVALAIKNPVVETLVIASGATIIGLAVYGILTMNNKDKQNKEDVVIAAVTGFATAAIVHLTIRKFIYKRT